MLRVPQPITRPKLLLGEGQDEVRFFGRLLAHLRITDVDVADYAGKTRLSAYVQTLPDRSGFQRLESVAITRDADGSAADAFCSVRDALARAGLPTPPTHASFTDTNPRFGVFVLPDGDGPGMLEDVCCRAVAQDPAMPCVQQYLDCVRVTAGRYPKSEAKARVHVWLASHPDPDRRLGEAAEAGYFDWESPAFDALKAFLRAL